MANMLQQKFPVIQTREQILQEILSDSHLLNKYLEWSLEQRELFLDMFSGAVGVKMLYDSFFKIVFNPDVYPERLEKLLSLLLEQKVKILNVLPNEGTKIADEGNLLVMDIVIQMADGSIANVECQKNGYAFPGQRAACYSADLLMRQYRRVKGERKGKFSYRDIKNVYTIIFYEKSPREFKISQDRYIYHSAQTMDGGIKLNLIQEYVFINLDIYFKIHQNSIIENELDAWLMFLGTDCPERIIALIEQYPYFEELYRDIYVACRNTERGIYMFSEELKILDRNTVQYMIDEMEEEIKKQKSQIDEQKNQIDEQKSQIGEQKSQLNRLKKENSELEMRGHMLEQICRNYLKECRENGEDRDSALKNFCKKFDLDEEMAEKQIERFWPDESPQN